MPRLLIRGSLIALGLVLSILGAAALLLTALVAAPLKKPPPLASISNSARAVDRSTIPDIERATEPDLHTVTIRYAPLRSGGWRY